MCTHFWRHGLFDQHQHGKPETRETKCDEERHRVSIARDIWLDEVAPSQVGNPGGGQPRQCGPHADEKAPTFYRDHLRHQEIEDDALHPHQEAKEEQEDRDRDHGCWRREKEASERDAEHLQAHPEPDHKTDRQNLLAMFDEVGTEQRRQKHAQVLNGTAQADHKF